MNDPGTHINPSLEEVKALRQRLIELEQSQQQSQQQIEQLTQQLAQEQTARQQAEERLQLTLSSAQVVSWDMDISANRVICSAHALEIWGIQEGSREDFFALVHPDDRQQVIQAAERAMAGERVYCQEYRVIGPNGIVRWLNSRGQVYLDDTGRGIRMIGLSVDVTARKHTEVALHESEEQLKLANERFQLAAKAVNCAIYDWHLETDQVERTDGLTRLLGYSLEEAEPNSRWWRDRIHPDDLQIMVDQALTSFTQDDYFTAEYRVLNKSNQYVDVLDQSLVVERDATGQPSRIVGSTTDISDRKRDQHQLQESQRFIQQIADSIPGTLYVYDVLEQRNVYVNRQIGELLGYTPEQIQAFGAQLFPQLMHPDDFSELGNEVEQLNQAQEGQVVDHEYRMRHANGEWRWLWSRNTVATRMPDGQAHQIVGTAHDITDRKQTEAALAKSNQTLQAIIQACPLAIMGLQADGTVQIWNPAAERIFGWSQPEVLGAFLPAIPDNKRQEFLNNLALTIQGQGLVGVETQRQKKGNILFDVELWSASVDETQADISCVAIVADITERKRVEAERQEVEESLRQSEKRYRYLAESIPQLVWTANPEGVLIDVNQRWSTFTGLTLDQAKTAGWGAVVHPDDVPILDHHWAIAQQHGTDYQAEGRIRRTDGVYRWHLHQAVPLKTEQGHVIKWFGTATDIEDQKQLEQDRIHLLRQEQIAREQAEAANRIKDEFLAVLSHELRTPLNPILGWARLLRTRQFDTAATNRALETIERNAKLQAQLIEDLLDVSRILQGKVGLNASAIHLINPIEAALDTVRLSAEAKGIQVQTVFDATVGQINGDANRLQQVVWNLLSNAIKFTPAGGQIEVKLEPVWHEAASQHAQLPTLNPPTHAQITVRDTGPGISPDFLPYVFEYFRQADSSTTRHFGGLGLGLAIARHLVELHGGTVRADSPGLGMGATFTVQLPLMVSAATPDLEACTPEPTQNLHGIHILIVDDEADMRDLIRFILEEQDATVRVAASANETLQQLAEFMPDILISDIGMPDVDGYALIKQIRATLSEQSPMIPAIALTAYAGEIDHQQALAAGFQQHLPKPVEPEVLINAIADLVQSVGVQAKF